MKRDRDRAPLRDLLIAVSLANLCLMRVWRELLYVDDADRYWSPSISSEALLAALANLSCMTLAFWAAARLARRGGKAIETTGRLTFVAVWAIPLNYLRDALDVGSEALYWLLSHPWVGAAIAVAALVFAIYLLFFQLVRVSRLGAILAIVFSPFAALTAGQALWAVAVTDSSLVKGDAIALSPTAVEGRHGAPRAVWLMFDELDLRLTFLERPEWLELPNFDRLREQALFGLTPESHSKNTRLAIPSYTVGRLVSSASAYGADDLRLEFEGGERPPVSWKRLSTFFSEASALGANVGAIGIYHPYCRLFAEHLAYCEQYAIGTYSPQPAGSLQAEMAAQLQALTPLASRLNGIDIYRAIAANSLEAVADPRLDVVYVHASVPHGPTIFDFRTRSFTPFVRDPLAYFGNLLLADRYLGEIRSRMEQAGAWQSTTVLVTSDHEWRRAANYDGTRASTIPFVLKLAGQSEPLDYERSFSPMLVAGDLLIEVLRGELSSPESVVDWLDGRAR